jgi:hypothetical protein
LEPPHQRAVGHTSQRPQGGTGSGRGLAATTALSGLMLGFQRLGLVGEQPPGTNVKRLQLATGRAPRRGAGDWTKKAVASAISHSL